MPRVAGYLHAAPGTVVSTPHPRYRDFANPAVGRVRSRRKRSLRGDSLGLSVKRGGLAGDPGQGRTDMAVPPDRRLSVTVRGADPLKKTAPVTHRGRLHLAVITELHLSPFTVYRPGGLNTQPPETALRNDSTTDSYRSGSMFQAWTCSASGTRSYVTRSGRASASSSLVSTGILSSLSP